MDEAVRLLKVVIGNQVVTGDRLDDLERKINTNTELLNKIIKELNSRS